MQHNWSEFYNALCQQGPDLLVGIDEDLREVIKQISTTTDMFWSESLEERLEPGAVSSSLRDCVLQALDQWRYNVIDALEAAFGITLEMDDVTINADSPIVDRLVDATAQDGSG
jgi:hypothetical protein